MAFTRASGILLHPTSLPGPYGIGDFGPDAFEFVDFLVSAGQTYWQILPLGPIGYGASPYSSFSAFAGNTLLISPEKLIEDGLLTAKQIADLPPFPTDKVDYGAVEKWKAGIFKLALDAFHKDSNTALQNDFNFFTREHSWWLDDYALFRALKLSENGKSWNNWEPPLRVREKNALDQAAVVLAADIEAEKFYQFLFYRQWLAFKKYANKNSVKIIGDMPIFVAQDSSDVWCNQNIFKLETDGSPAFAAGVPPDYFSKTGQLWGNPVYDWDAMRGDGFRWWVARMSHLLQFVDIVRLDHFRGFVAAWEVPGTDKTAENGQWVDAPGREFFTALENSLGKLPIIAEDLGVITPEVDELRDAFDFPGMRILQFAFGGDAQNRDLPHNYVNNCVAYTGTHDNDTIIGWWLGSDAAIREHCLKYLDTDGSEINWDLIRVLWESVADTVIVPLQDVLGLGNGSRMNLPASTSGNWQWRYIEGSITSEIVEKLKVMTEIYGR